MAHNKISEQFGELGQRQGGKWSKVSSLSFQILRSLIVFTSRCSLIPTFQASKCQPFDILTFCNSDNLIFHWKTVLRKWVSSSSSCIYLTTNRFALEPLNAVFCEELFGVTIIWPFKSFMRPVLPLAVVGGTNKLCRIPTAFTPRREKRAFTGPPIILHLLPLHSNTSLDLVVKVQIVESECGGRVYCVFGAKGLTPGSPRALPPISHLPPPTPCSKSTPQPSSTPITSFSL